MCCFTVRLRWLIPISKLERIHSHGDAHQISNKTRNMIKWKCESRGCKYCQEMVRGITDLDKVVSMRNTFSAEKGSYIYFENEHRDVESTLLIHKALPFPPSTDWIMVKGVHWTMIGLESEENMHHASFEEDESERTSYISHWGGRGHLDNSSWVLESFEL